tara:strand:+ start:674 stop:1078 length:405 start_codon:yes stop_codon:yes gene_type:complete
MVEATRAQRRQLEIDNRAWPKALTPVPAGTLPPWRLATAPPIEVWRSSAFLVMVFIDHGHERLTINRTSHVGQSWAQNITWDEIHNLKAECGRGDRWAVEVYPPDREVVNVANMRHIWLLPEPPPYGWHRGEAG